VRNAKISEHLNYWVARAGFARKNFYNERCKLG